MAANLTENCPEGEVLYKDGTKENGLFALSLLIVSLVYLLVFQVWYLIRQQTSKYLKHRFALWVYVATFGMVTQLCGFLLREYTGRASFPCWVTRQFMVWFTLFLALPCCLRAAMYYYTIRLNQKLAKVAFSAAAKENDINEIYGSAGSAGTGITGEEDEDISEPDRTNTFTFGVPDTSKPRNRGGSFENGSILTSNQSAKTAHSKSEFRFYLYMIDPKRFGLHAYALGFLVVSGFSFLFTNGTGDCTGCDVRGEDLLIVVSVSFVFIPLMNYWFWIIRKEPDPLNLKWEMGYILLPAGGLALGWALTHFLDPGNLNRDGKLTWHYLWLLVCVVTWSCMVPYQIFRSYQYDRFALKMDLLENQATLEEVLESEIGSEKFKTHLVHELCIETLLFWREATRWKTTFNRTRSKRRLRKLLEIYETYIKPGSPLENNVSWRLKTEVGLAIENNTVTENTLDKCIRNVWGLMEQDIFPRFVVSDLYKEYRDATTFAENRDALRLQESI